MEFLSIANINEQLGFTWREKDPQRWVTHCTEYAPIFGSRCRDYLEPNPPTYSIRNNIAPRRGLPDGDGINIRIKDAAPGDVEIVLSVYHQITWWKGLRLFETYPRRDVELSVYGRGSVAPGEPDDRVQTEPIVLKVDAIRLSSQLYPGREGAIWLGKAKVFGVHEWIYSIPLVQFLPFDGKRVQFHWYGDG